MKHQGMDPASNNSSVTLSIWAHSCHAIFSLKIMPSVLMDVSTLISHERVRTFVSYQRVSTLISHEPNILFLQ